MNRYESIMIPYESIMNHFESIWAHASRRTNSSRENPWFSLDEFIQQDLAGRIHRATSSSSLISQDEFIRLRIHRATNSSGYEVIK